MHNEAPYPIDGYFTDLAEADISPPFWVIDNILPAGIVFLAGPPKTMKSTLEMAFSLAVAGVRAEVLPADMTQVRRPGTVMGLSAEASAGELRHMVEHGMKVQMPADRRIVIADDPWQFRLDDPEAQQGLMFWLKERRPRLFWLDPLRDFHNLEERDSGGMNRLLRPVQQWAKENGCCFLVVHHTRKKSNEDKTDYDAGDMRGTTALFGIADGVIMVTPRQGGKLYLKGTYKRGAEWERTITLNTWGMDDSTEQARQLTGALDEVEKAVLASLHAKQPLSALYDMHGERVEQTKLRLLSMNVIQYKGKKVELTELGKDTARHLSRKGMK